ncbi:uncharacterized protein si:dkey-195m11.11 [Xyrauchen texanus]|uniref:uncharacterized protein si:dkey-195m11.11 n=1 Tax=Xyrauchen texanus TaxID=154827 RepID=UPI002242A587|nr:uncharacterized protein si:dkey-195m11.11 [Xyrauchen texanus]
MILPNVRVLAVVCWMMYVRLTVSRVSIPTPKLWFFSNLNESNIQLYTKVSLGCPAPSGAPYPITVSIGKIESPSQTPATTEPFVTSEVITYPDKYLYFNIIAQHSQEGTLVCWYKSTRTGEISEFSNNVTLVISSLPPPKLTLEPNLFRVGGNYTVFCDSTAGPATNFSMSLFYRPLPVATGNSLTLIGTVNVTGVNHYIFSTVRYAVNRVEYVCTMEMLYHGRHLYSPMSNFEAAIPEELPIRLLTNDHEASCLGNLDINLRDKWVPVCQKEINTANASSTAAATAEVVCRELGCGHALGWKRVQDNRLLSTHTTGGINCSGSERKTRDCPMDDVQFCKQINTLSILCSDVLPPPKLSVVTYDRVSKLYVTDKQSVEISCYFDSTFLKSGDTGRLLLRRSGIVERSTYMTPGMTVSLTQYAPVPEGKYECLFKLDAGTESISPPSNSVFIYIYNPPDPVPIVAGVLTTAVGVAIMMYVCVYKTSSEMEVNTTPTHFQGPEATQIDTKPESSVNYLPQHM